MAEHPIHSQADWWECLADIIRPLLPVRPECEKLLRFLQRFIESVETDAILSLASGKQRCVNVDTDLKPVSLSVENWERFVLSLGLEIERPDFSVEFAMISILTTCRVQEFELQHVMKAIEALIDMDFTILSQMVGMNKTDIHQVWCLIMNLSRDEDLRRLCSTNENQELRNLWDKYQGVLGLVGFVQTGRGSQSYISYQGTDRNVQNYKNLREFLHGALLNPVEESFV